MIARTTFRFVPTLTRLEHREGPAALTPDSLLFPTDFPTADTVLIPDSSDGTSTTIRALAGVESAPENVTDRIAVTATSTSGHNSQPLDHHNTLSQVTQGISVESPGVVIPSVPGKASNDIATVPSHTQDHVYAPPHRSAPVRVPVD